MASNIIKLLIIIFLFISSFASFAQTDTKAPNAMAKSPTRDLVIRSKSDSLSKALYIKINESDFYKLMYENEKDTSAKFISLTQWTFGGALSVLLAIIGLQSFFNFRINSSKINEIEFGLQTRFAELALELAGRISEETAVATTTTIAVS